MPSTKISREKFLSNLEAVTPGLALRDVVEQSSCFILQDGEVITYNEEVCCRGSSGLSKEFNGAVSADIPIKLLQKLTDDDIEVIQNDGKFIIKGKNKQGTFRMEAEIHLPVNNVEKPEEWKELHEDFGDAVKMVQQCASEDEDKRPLTCVHITPKWVEACDNFQLCRWRLKTGVKEPILVRQTSVKHIVTSGMTEFCETENWLHFRNQRGLVLSCRRYKEEYHDLSELLAVEGVPIVLPSGLEEAVEKAEFCSSEVKDNNLVEVDLEPGKVRVRGVGVSGEYWERKKLKYDGPPMSFMISPSILSELVKNNNECKVSEGSLLVDGERYKYVTVLNQKGGSGEES